MLRGTPYLDADRTDQELDGEVETAPLGGLSAQPL